MNKSDWISASDAGRARFCPKYLHFKYSGVEISQAAHLARLRGDSAHAQFNQSIESEDKRCFIASHLYGIDDIRTVHLRQFRDRRLMTNWLGRLLIKGYYWLSPYLVRACRANSIMDILVRKTVDQIIKSLLVKLS